ncbi:hypothetical protein WBG78_25020 [Chryseolinea sp. T2]|uniref:hypothetical protein n=1 Tax=Chryseolinea sp. T2 TaxID=3129255 RepID=UPI0030769BD3
MISLVITRALMLAATLALETNTFVYSQNLNESASNNEHAILLNSKFRLLNQPFYCRLFDVLQPRDVLSDEVNSNGLIIACWSSDNRESIEEYKKLLSKLSVFEKNWIILIGVSFDNDKKTWLQTIEREQLINRWNCFFDLQLMKQTGKDSTLFHHYKETSLPFSLSIRNGVVVGAYRSIRLDEREKP